VRESGQKEYGQEGNGGIKFRKLKGGKMDE